MTNGGLITSNVFELGRSRVTGHHSLPPSFQLNLEAEEGEKYAWGGKRGRGREGMIYQPMAYKLHSCAASSFDFEFVQLLFSRESLSFESFYFHIDLDDPRDN